MFRPYRTLKIKVPRPCCPWCQAHLERIEQKLQAMEEQILELSARLATPPAATGGGENAEAGILTALRVMGVAFRPQPSGEDSPSQTAGLIGEFTAMIAALDRLAEAPVWQAPQPLAGSRPKTLVPRQLPQIAAPLNGSEYPAEGGIS